MASFEEILASSAGVLSPVLKVFVNGVHREHISAEWGIDTTGGLPDTLVNAGTGIRSRTGTVVFAPEKAVSVDGPHPLRRQNSWPPRPGDKVRIVATLAGNDVVRFTGRLGRVSADFFYSGAITAEITDGIGDTLIRTVTVPPQVATGSNYLRSSWVAVQAVDAAGLGHLPALAPECIIHDNFQSGIIPTAGTFRTSGTGFGEPYGLTSISGASITAREHTRGSQAYTVITRAVWNETASVQAHFGQVAITLEFEAGGTMALHVSGKGAVWRGRWEGEKEPVKVLAFRINGGAVDVAVSRQKRVTAYNDSSLSQATLQYATGQRIIGLDVRLGDFIRYTETLPIYPAAYHLSNLERERITASRGYENESVEKIISDWSAATLSVGWMDELGKPYFMARSWLVGGFPLRQVNLRERTFDGSWSIGRDGIRSSVKVKGIFPTKKGGNHAPVVYQPDSRQEIEYGVAEEEFISVPDEQDWIGVRTNWLPVADIARGVDNTERFNKDRQNSYYSVVVQSEADREVQRYAYTETVEAKLETLGQRTLKMTHKITGTRTPSDSQYYLATSNAPNTKLYGIHRDKGAPIIRADWLVEWADFTVEGNVKIPNSLYPDFVLESDWWLTQADARRVANALAVELTTENITFDAVSLLWDPTRHVGDSETWQMLDSAGQPSWTAQVLITGYSEAWEGHVPSQKVDAQVKSMVDNLAGKTYDDLARAYSTYQVMGDQNATYNQIYNALPGKVNQ